MSGAFIDKTGLRFGLWTVLARVSNNRHGQVVWRCRCACGNERDVKGCALTKGGRSKSCGCDKSGYEKLRKGPGEVGKKRFFWAYKNDACARGYDWSLSDEAALELATHDCWYCGAPPRPRAVPSNSGHGTTIATLKLGEFTCNGLDRFDNTRGYEPGNVVACCKDCNLAKRDREAGEFLAWVERVHAHQDVKRPFPIIKAS